MNYVYKLYYTDVDQHGGGAVSLSLFCISGFGGYKSKTVDSWLWDDGSDRTYHWVAHDFQLALTW